MRSQGETRAGGEAAGLPCLSSNNCTEGAVALSSQQKKSAAALALNVQDLAERHGLERLGFLTLTFPDHVVDPKEAQRRYRSLRAHVLKPRYGSVVRAYERQKSGRIHYHLVVALPVDIRTGFDFDRIERHDYSSASDALRAEWAFWRTTARRYGFGRTELLPIRSTSEGIARYVGKYIGKSISARDPRDKGVRLVEYCGSARMANTRFMFLSEGSATWRNKMRTFALVFAERMGVENPTFDDLRAALGPRWAHNHRDFIAALPETTVDGESAPANSGMSPVAVGCTNLRRLVANHAFSWRRAKFQGCNPWDLARHCGAVPFRVAPVVGQPSFASSFFVTAAVHLPPNGVSTQAQPSTNPRVDKPSARERSAGGACGRVPRSPVKVAHAHRVHSGTGSRILPPFTSSEMSYILTNRKGDIDESNANA